jgi:hypothetical protein
MVRKMHPTLLLPILFRLVALLAIVSVRGLFIPARLRNSFL